MDDRTRNSTLGEAQIICEFLKQGYDVFMQFGGKCAIDMIVQKNGKLLRVEVKSTKSRSSYDTG